jgi:hypothetical protein
MPTNWNELLRKKPMNLFRSVVIAPPSRSPVMLEDKGKLADVPASSFDSKDAKPGQVKGWAVPSKGRIMYISFQTMPYRPNCLTFNVSAKQESPDWVPVWFLPWTNMGVVSMQIENVGRNYYDPDDPQNPGIFFTAAINGCSVFARGNPKEPTVYHAGIDNKFSKDLDVMKFWRDRAAEMATLEGSSGKGFATGEVNKSHYINDPSLGMFKTKDSIAFENWLTDENKNPSLTIQSVNASGCVFGIRYGATWAFYLQESAQVQVLKFVKKADLEFKNNGYGVNMSPKGYGPTSPQSLVSMEQKKHFGFIPGKKIYKTVTTYDRPMVIREFFPTRSAEVKIKDEVKVVW